ncbi:hypothetical protein DSECCO2_660870 [anaerobic digester metagenome]
MVVFFPITMCFHVYLGVVVVNQVQDFLTYLGFIVLGIEGAPVRTGITVVDHQFTFIHVTVLDLLKGI